MRCSTSSSRLIPKASAGTLHKRNQQILSLSLAVVTSSRRTTSTLSSLLASRRNQKKGTRASTRSSAPRSTSLTRMAKTAKRWSRSWRVLGREGSHHRSRPRCPSSPSPLSSFSGSDPRRRTTPLARTPHLGTRDNKSLCPRRFTGRSTSSCATQSACPRSSR